MDEKWNLVVIDTDHEYLKQYEEELFRRYSPFMRVQFITDSAYVEKFFADRKQIDLLVVDQRSYGEYLQMHEIGNIFLMTPEVEVGRIYPENVKVLMKYVPEEEVFRAIDQKLCSMGLLNDRHGSEKKSARMIAVYSPIGGCGKSLAALAIARKLKKLDQKVLLVSCDAMQSTAAFYPFTDTADEDLARKLQQPTEDTYWTSLSNTKTDGISYLKPFQKYLPALHVGMREWQNLLDVLKNKEDFDYIVMDIGTVLGPDGAELLGMASLMVMVTENNEISNRKMQKLLKNPDLLPRCECILLSNEYHSDGLRFSPDSIFGSLVPYSTWQEALDDPVFYRIALKITE